MHTPLPPQPASLSGLGQTKTPSTAVSHRVKCHICLLWGLGLLLALAGCGGAGGGSSSGGSSGLGPTAVSEWLAGGCSLSAPNGQILFRPAWPSGAGPDSSQVLQLVTGSGTVIRTESFNRGPAEITISSVPAGVYELRAQAFAGLNGTGASLGTLRTMVDICTSPSAIVAASSSAASNVAAFPASPEITTLQTVRIVAQPRTSGGDAAFSTASPSFTAVGSGAVTSAGVVQPSGIGVVNVTARLGTLEGTSAVKVGNFTVTRSKWTVLVYLNAANDLFSASDLNVNQMEQVAGNPDVRFVVQWKQSQAAYPSSTFDGVRRYLVKPDTTSTIKSQILQSDLRGGDGQPLDMGSPAVMNDFIKWGKANFPADRYTLVIWNHGNGWRRSAENELTRGFSYDDVTGNSIDIWEIDSALAGETFDIIAWDCSLMQMAEVAYELRNYAAYVIGSEESPPADGYPYDAVFKVFRDSPNASTRDLTKAFVDGMINHPPYFSRKITQSSIDTSRLGALASAADSLAAELIAAGPSIEAPLAAIRSATQSYSLTTFRHFRDIRDFCQRLEASASMPAGVKTAAASLRAAFDSAVVWEASNANSPNSNGLSFDLSPGNIFSGVQSDYRRMDWATDTRWDEFLLQSPNS